MRHNIAMRLVIVIVFVCSIANGSELSDLVTRLQKLEGKEKIQASVNIENYTSAMKGEKSNKIKSDFIIRTEAQNISLKYSGEISKIASDPNAGKSAYGGDTSDTANFQQFNILRAIELMNYGPFLAREIEGMKVVKKSSEKYQGVSCTLLTLNSKETQKNSGIKATTKRDVKIWIDGEGYPIAGSFKTVVSARILLVLKISTESSREQRFTRKADHLVLSFDKNETELKTDEGNMKQIVTTKVEIKDNSMQI